MLDIKITGGRIADIRNRQLKSVDVGVKDGKIVQTGTDLPDAAETVDAAGLVVSPGFIDIHMHEEDLSITQKKCWDTAECMLRMGVTTAVGGNCGSNRQQPSEMEDLMRLQGGPVKTDRGISQDPFLVLWRTAMPAVLLELGFISNSNDLTALRSQSERDKLAERVFQAVKEYKGIYDGTLDVPAPESGHTQVNAGKEMSDGGSVYAVQIFAVRRKMDPAARDFLGYAPRIIESGGLYKYYIGVSDSKAAAKKEWTAIKKKYPESFLVRIDGEKVTREE